MNGSMGPVTQARLAVPIQTCLLSDRLQVTAEEADDWLAKPEAHAREE